MLASKQLRVGPYPNAGAVSRGETGSAHLLESLRVHQDPPNLYDLGRVFGNVDAMLVTGRSHMNDNVAVHAERSWRESRHAGWSVALGASELVVDEAQWLPGDLITWRQGQLEHNRS